MTQDYIFDDGTIESKVLQHEIPDAKVIKVDKFESIEKWLSHVGHMEGLLYRVFLHFPGEDYTQKDIYTQVMESERRHQPEIRIVKQYEMATRESIKRRADNYGIKDEPEPVVEKKEEPKPEVKKPVEIEFNSNRLEAVGKSFTYKPEESTQPTKKRRRIFR